jgi:2-desacetyl-2-hydroxyethyl bacteriochlorophyllide A dehydrogenase
MKAAIYNGQKDVVVTEVDTPVPGEHDVLLKNLCAGVCGSDVRSYYGSEVHNILVGEQFGHEVVSKVVAKGSKVEGIEVGDRVYPYSRAITNNPGALGGFSEYILAPHAQLGRELYKVDDTISDKVAAMIEPFTVGTKAARRARPEPGESAIVFGAGTIGVSAAVALRRFGLEKVMLVDLSDYRLEKVAALGFATCNSAREDLLAKAIEVFGATTYRKGTTADADIYIEASGADPALATMISIAKKFSRLVVVGVHDKPVALDLVALTYGQLEMIGSGGYEPEDVAFVLDLMASQQFDLEPIVTHQYSLDEISTAIEKAADVHSALHVSIAY